MLSPWYRARWGRRWKLVGDVNRVTEVKNNHSGFRMATSVDGRGTGRGGDILICDDPHNLKDVASDTKRAAVHEWWRKVWSTRRNGPNSGRVTIMQRSHSDDLASRIIDDGAAVLSDSNGIWTLQLSSLGPLTNNYNCKLSPCYSLNSSLSG